jgi:hypothetical protein
MSHIEELGSAGLVIDFSSSVKQAPTAQEEAVKEKSTGRRGYLSFITHSRIGHNNSQNTRFCYL